MPDLHGTFRRDLRLVEGPQGTLALVRRTGPRALSIALVLAATALAAIDARAGRPWLAAVHATLVVGFLFLLIRAEMDRFRFDGRAAVRRWLTLGGFCETRLEAKAIARIGVLRTGKRGRVWIETKDGDRYAVIEGKAEEVERIAARLANAVRFAAAEPGSTEVH